MLWGRPRASGFLLAMTLLTAFPLNVTQPRGSAPPLNVTPAGGSAPSRRAAGAAMAWAPVIGLLLGALAAGFAVVAAAGNNNSQEPFWPAAFKRVVSVGALDTRDGTARLAGFSNHGAWVDVYVPGVRILSTYLEATWKLPSDPEPRALDGYAYWSGTSFAAPQVAAMTANALPAAGSARQAVLDVLAQATWIPGLGPALIPEPGVAGLSAVARLSAVAEAD